MKHILCTFLILGVAAGCTQKPAPASDVAIPAATERLAIAVEFVAVPSMSVYSRPAPDADVIGSYGFTEAISILQKNGEWCQIRTFDGSGWVKQSDLVASEQAGKLDTTTPRFYVAPAAVPFLTRGEIALQAKVNTDGEVISVTTTRNTTGSAALAAANADALKMARFYPVIEKGTRKTFVYEHHIYY